MMPLSISNLCAPFDYRYDDGSWSLSIRVREAMTMVSDCQKLVENAWFRTLQLAFVMPVVATLCSGSNMGDPPPGEVAVAKVTQGGSDIMFSPPLALDPVTIELWDLVINRRTETDGQVVTVWRLEGRSSSSGHMPSVEWPIKYGTRLANMNVVVQPVPLLPGHYIFGADIFVRHGAEPVQKSKLMLLNGAFTLNAEMRLE